MKAKNCLLLIPFLIFGCTSVEQTTQSEKERKPEVYVFDDVSKIDTSVVIPEKKEKLKEDKSDFDNSIVRKYVVQLGAFTTKERAQLFISENQAKTSLPMSIEFNNQTKLYSVVLPPYNTKEEADLVRDNLRKIPVFRDAFTTTKMK